MFALPPCLNIPCLPGRRSRPRRPPWTSSLTGMRWRAISPSATLSAITRMFPLWSARPKTILTAMSKDILSSSNTPQSQQTQQFIIIRIFTLRNVKCFVWVRRFVVLLGSAVCRDVQWVLWQTRRLALDPHGPRCCNICPAASCAAIKALFALPQYPNVTGTFLKTTVVPAVRQIALCRARWHHCAQEEPEQGKRHATRSSWRIASWHAGRQGPRRACCPCPPPCPPRIPLVPVVLLGPLCGLGALRGLLAGLHLGGSFTLSPVCFTLAGVLSQGIIPLMR